MARAGQSGTLGGVAALLATLTGIAAAVGGLLAGGALSGTAPGTAGVDGGLAGVGQVIGQANANTDAGASAAVSTVFAYDFFVYGSGTGQAPSESNSGSGGLTCSSTCGNGSQACCGGWQSAARTAGTTCGTSFGNSGPHWWEMSGTTKHASIVAANATRPLSLPALGNALAIPADTNDLSRIARTIDTSAGSFACKLGACDSSSDAAGHPMVTGTYYVGMIAWAASADTSSVFGGCHLFQGLVFTSTCSQDKPNEKIQFISDNINTTYVMARTTQGTSEGSNWHSSTAFNTTPHAIVYKIEDGISGTCNTPDDNGNTVTCTTGTTRVAITLWIDASTEAATPARSRRIIANLGNSRGLNTIECSGTLAFNIEQLCFATTYVDALNCPIP